MSARCDLTDLPVDGCAHCRTSTGTSAKPDIFEQTYDAVEPTDAR